MNSGKGASETIMPYTGRHSVVAFSKKSDQISHVPLVVSFMYVFIHSFILARCWKTRGEWHRLCLWVAPRLAGETPTFPSSKHYLTDYRKHLETKQDVMTRSSIVTLRGSLFFGNHSKYTVPCWHYFLW